MMTRSSSSINSPELEQLAKLKAMSDAAQAHKYFQDNPKVVDNLASSIQAAYALTEGERKERDDAVQAVVNAKAELKEAQDEKTQAISDAAEIKKEADEYSKNVITSADSYKKEAFESIEVAHENLTKEWEKLHEEQNQLAADKKQLAKDQDAVKDGMETIANWRVEKESWEQDYTGRSDKLDAKLRKAVKG